jgi:hypothetical protein
MDQKQNCRMVLASIGYGNTQVTALDLHHITFPGITVPGGKGIDLNRYEGTKDQLKAEWK